MFSIIDASLAAQNMVTAAEMLGLGSVFVRTPTQHPHEVDDLLSLPEGVYPLVLLCIGYPDEEPKKTYRWSSSSVVHYDEYEDLEEEEIEDYAETIEEFTGLEIEDYSGRQNLFVSQKLRLSERRNLIPS